MVMYEERGGEETNTAPREYIQKRIRSEPEKTKERALVCVWSENHRPEESDTKGNGTGKNCPDEYVSYESRILIIGATGTVGRQVASQLASTDVKARALVRQLDAARLPAEIEVVRGDLTFPETLDRSLNGVGTVFLVWTAPSAGVAPALERIASHAERIVFLSAPFKTPHPLFQQPNPSRALAEQIERLIESSGLQWTFLRPGMFAANALRWWAPPIRADDVVRWPYLAAPTAPVDERDIAAVAVRALREDGHARAEYVLTGPQIPDAIRAGVHDRSRDRPLAAY
jgi:uncharacterized protein YbjT (DUF2867 family)